MVTRQHASYLVLCLIKGKVVPRAWSRLLDIYINTYVNKYIFRDNFLKINIRQKYNTNKDGTYFKLLLTYFGYPFAFVKEDESLQ